jgi:hypothetical protein
MTEKEKTPNKTGNAQSKSHETKVVKRYSGKKNEKLSEKQNETQTGLHTPRGKKQRRQFKLAPNRG